ncbi:hypothetical protein J4H86_00855 [Spiractinospora alimapuensis]|uniref:S26 family signal peptidase n=1 Tax=Spiractinospora alimapuensis TaxID=2820884 RepID=UPI001F28DBED|nr:S26 family signal peptidase [Spiractinospora alimapuensis]QVQ52443.1 hypothetical protein J4H86_00855 [Spiractinospora alimapuensis]
MSFIAVVVTSLVVALIGGVLWARRRYLVVTVHGSSMAPTYHDGERLLALRNRRHGAPTRDTVVVVDLPRIEVDVASLGGPDRHVETPTTTTVHGRLIKRVAAVAGDPVPDDVISDRSHVPEGMVALRGDNADASIDSRHYGLIHARHCLGTVRRRMG